MQNTSSRKIVSFIVYLICVIGGGIFFSCSKNHSDFIGTETVDAKKQTNSNSYDKTVNSDLTKFRLISENGVAYSSFLINDHDIHVKVPHTE